LIAPKNSRLHGSGDGGLDADLGRDAGEFGIVGDSLEIVQPPPTTNHRKRSAGCVIAHTLPEMSPSTGVLSRCGFAYVADVADPDGEVEGVVWRWELEPADLGRTIP
jgi:hypothetical protein